MKKTYLNSIVYRIV